MPSKSMIRPKSSSVLLVARCEAIKVTVVKEGDCEWALSDFTLFGLSEARLGWKPLSRCEARNH